MSLSRTTGRIATLSLLSVLLALIAYDGRLSPSRSLQGAVFYNCYSCTPDSQCQLQVVHERVQGESPCALLGLQTTCAAACKCPQGVWPCSPDACTANFKKYENWISYQLGTEGYVGSVFDRSTYLYLVPFRGDNGPQGTVLRYNTKAVLNSAPSWESFDPSSNGLSAAARGFSGGAFDGRYIYFAPNENASGPSGAVMRYDTTKNMAAVTSWELFDPSASGLGAAAKGFNGAVFDGRFVYFVPAVNASGGHNDVMRYDVTKPFASASSWELFNPKSAASTKKGYAGAIYDGRYVYFIPSGKPDVGASTGGASSTGASGTCGNGICDSNETAAAVDCVPGSSACNKVLCLQDCGQAALPSAPTTASILTGQVTGRPAGSSDMHGDVLRYDTRAPFKSTTSWTTFDPSSNGVGSNARGYNGGVFDGTYIYFAPYINSSGPHGEVLRYNTKQPFATASSWTTFNVSTGGVDADAKGYIGAAFDGQFVYFAPYFNGKAYHGKVLRYDTKGAYSDKLSWTVYDIGTAKAATSSAGGTGGSKRYEVFTASANITWMDAEASCVSKGGHLASITSFEENTAAIAVAGTKTNVWIGLNDRTTEGDYKWTSGVAFSYNDWEIGQPNGMGIDDGISANDCVFMNHPNPGKWHDVGCNDPAFQTPNYLCELPGGAASSASTVPTGGGGAGTLGVTGPNGETPINNVLTVPSGSRVQFSWNCPGSPSVDSYSGYQGTAITCQLKNNGTTVVSNALQSGGTSVLVSGNGSYTFKCSWLLYNSVSQYEQVVCDKNTTINVSN